jgi:hypothetical protein
MEDHVKDLLREIAVTLLMQNAGESNLVVGGLQRALIKFDAAENNEAAKYRGSIGGVPLEIRK